MRNDAGGIDCWMAGELAGGPYLAHRLILIGMASRPSRKPQHLDQHHTLEGLQLPSVSEILERDPCRKQINGPWNHIKGMTGDVRCLYRCIEVEYQGHVPLLLKL